MADFVVKAVNLCIVIRDLNKKEFNLLFFERSCLFMVIFTSNCLAKTIKSQKLLNEKIEDFDCM